MSMAETRDRNVKLCSEAIVSQLENESESKETYAFNTDSSEKDFCANEDKGYDLELKAEEGSDIDGVINPEIASDSQDYVLLSTKLTNDSSSDTINIEISEYQDQGDSNLYEESLKRDLDGKRVDDFDYASATGSTLTSPCIEPMCSLPAYEDTELNSVDVENEDIEKLTNSVDSEISDDSPDYLLVSSNLGDDATSENINVEISEYQFQPDKSMIQGKNSSEERGQIAQMQREKISDDESVVISNIVRSQGKGESAFSATCDSPSLKESVCHLEEKRLIEDNVSSMRNHHNITVSEDVTDSPEHTLMSSDLDKDVTLESANVEISKYQTECYESEDQKMQEKSLVDTERQINNIRCSEPQNEVSSCVNERERGAYFEEFEDEADLSLSKSFCKFDETSSMENIDILQGEEIQGFERRFSGETQDYLLVSSKYNDGAGSETINLEISEYQIPEKEKIDLSISVGEDCVDGVRTPTVTGQDKEMIDDGISTKIEYKIRDRLLPVEDISSTNKDTYIADDKENVSNSLGLVAVERGRAVNNAGSRISTESHEYHLVSAELSNDITSSKHTSRQGGQYDRDIASNVLENQPEDLKVQTTKLGYHGEEREVNVMTFEADSEQILTEQEGTRILVEVQGAIDDEDEILGSPQFSSYSSSSTIKVSIPESDEKSRDYADINVYDDKDQTKEEAKATSNAWGSKLQDNINLNLIGSKEKDLKDRIRCSYLTDAFSDKQSCTDVDTQVKRNNYELGNAQSKEIESMEDSDILYASQSGTINSRVTLETVNVIAFKEDSAEDLRTSTTDIEDSNFKENHSTIGSEVEYERDTDTHEDLCHYRRFSKSDYRPGNLDKVKLNTGEYQDTEVEENTAFMSESQYYLLVSSKFNESESSDTINVEISEYYDQFNKDSKEDVDPKAEKDVNKTVDRMTDDKRERGSCFIGAQDKNGSYLSNKDVCETFFTEDKLRTLSGEQKRLIEYDVNRTTTQEINIPKHATDLVDPTDYVMVSSEFDDASSEAVDVEILDYKITSDKEKKEHITEESFHGSEAQKSSKVNEEKETTSYVIGLQTVRESIVMSAGGITSLETEDGKEVADSITDPINDDSVNELINEERSELVRTDTAQVREEDKAKKPEQEPILLISSDDSPKVSLEKPADVEPLEHTPFQPREEEGKEVGERSALSFSEDSNDGFAIISSLSGSFLLLSSKMNEEADDDCLKIEVSEYFPTNIGDEGNPTLLNEVCIAQADDVMEENYEEAKSIEIKEDARITVIAYDKELAPTESYDKRCEEIHLEKKSDYAEVDCVTLHQEGEDNAVLITEGENAIKTNITAISEIETDTKFKKRKVELKPHYKINNELTKEQIQIKYSENESAIDGSCRNIKNVSTQEGEICNSENSVQDNSKISQLPFQKETSSPENLKWDSRVDRYSAEHHSTLKHTVGDESKFVSKGELSITSTACMKRYSGSSVSESKVKEYTEEISIETKSYLTTTVTSERKEDEKQANTKYSEAQDPAPNDEEGDSVLQGYAEISIVSEKEVDLKDSGLNKGHNEQATVSDSLYSSQRVNQVTSDFIQVEITEHPNDLITYVQTKDPVPALQTTSMNIPKGEEVVVCENKELMMQLESNLVSTEDIGDPLSLSAQSGLKSNVSKAQVIQRNTSIKVSKKGDKEIHEAGLIEIESGDLVENSHLENFQENKTTLAFPEIDKRVFDKANCTEIKLENQGTQSQDFVTHHASESVEINREKSFSIATITPEPSTMTSKETDCVDAPPAYLESTLNSDELLRNQTADITQIKSSFKTEGELHEYKSGLMESIGKNANKTECCDEEYEQIDVVTTTCNSVEYASFEINATTEDSSELSSSDLVKSNEMNVEIDPIAEQQSSLVSGTALNNNVTRRNLDNEVIKDIVTRSTATGEVKIDKQKPFCSSELQLNTVEHSGRMEVDERLDNTSAEGSPEKMAEFYERETAMNHELNLELASEARNDDYHLEHAKSMLSSTALDTSKQNRNECLVKSSDNNAEKIATVTFRPLESIKREPQTSTDSHATHECEIWEVDVSKEHDSRQSLPDTFQRSDKITNTDDKEFPSNDIVAHFDLDTCKALPQKSLDNDNEMDNAAKHQRYGDAKDNFVKSKREEIRTEGEEVKGSACILEVDSFNDKKESQPILTDSPFSGKTSLHLETKSEHSTIVRSIQQQVIVRCDVTVEEIVAENSEMKDQGGELQVGSDTTNTKDFAPRNSEAEEKHDAAEVVMDFSECHGFTDKGLKRDDGFVLSQGSTNAKKVENYKAEWKTRSSELLIRTATEDVLDIDCEKLKTGKNINKAAIHCETTEAQHIAHQEFGIEKEEIVGEGRKYLMKNGDEENVGATVKITNQDRQTLNFSEAETVHLKFDALQQENSDNLELENGVQCARTEHVEETASVNYYEKGHIQQMSVKGHEDQLVSKPIGNTNVSKMLHGIELRLSENVTVKCDEVNKSSFMTKSSVSHENLDETANVSGFRITEFGISLFHEGKSVETNDFLDEKQNDKVRLSNDSNVARQASGELKTSEGFVYNQNSHLPERNFDVKTRDCNREGDYENSLSSRCRDTKVRTGSLISYQNTNQESGNVIYKSVNQAVGFEAKEYNIIVVKDEVPAMKPRRIVTVDICEKSPIVVRQRSSSAEVLADKRETHDTASSKRCLSGVVHEETSVPQTTTPTSHHKHSLDLRLKDNPFVQDTKVMSFSSRRKCPDTTQIGSEERGYSYVAQSNNDISQTAVLTKGQIDTGKADFHNRQNSQAKDTMPACQLSHLEDGCTLAHTTATRTLKKDTEKGTELTVKFKMISESGSIAESGLKEAQEHSRVWKCNTPSHPEDLEDWILVNCTDTEVQAFLDVMNSKTKQ